jgi:hypothetical protein
LKRNFDYIRFIPFTRIKQLKGNKRMNKLLVALGLAATVALVGCNKDKAPETGATTGEHLENAANQAGHDISDATANAANETAVAVDNAAEATAAAADNVAQHAEDATVAAADAVEDGAANVKQEVRD